MADFRFDLSNRLYVLIGILVLTCFAFFGTVTFSILEEREDYSTLDVSATVKKEVSPDLATLSFRFEKESPDSGALTTEMNTLSKKGSEALVSLGIPVKDIKTHQVSVQPKYTWTDGVQKSEGYIGVLGVQVKTKNFELLEKIIQNMSAAGFQNIDSINFSIENYEEFLTQAREEAIHKARAKAESIAKASGNKLKGMQNYSESNNMEGNLGMPIYAKSADIRMESMAVDNNMDASAVNLGQGTQNVEITVNLNFKVKED